MTVKVTKGNASRTTRTRQSKNVEFLQTLQSLTGLNQTAFAKACGKKASNMNRYLSGSFQPAANACFGDSTAS